MKPRDQGRLFHCASKVLRYYLLALFGLAMVCSLLTVFGLATIAETLLNRLGQWILRLTACMICFVVTAVVAESLRD